MRSNDEMTVGEAEDAGLLRVSPAFRWSALTTVSGRFRLDMSKDAKAVAELIGTLSCAVLLKALRSRTTSGWLSIPKAIPNEHWIRVAIGDKLADRLQQAMGGRKLDVRRRDVFSVAQRDDWIRWACRQGESAEEVARRYGVTSRRVRQLRALDQ